MGRANSLPPLQSSPSTFPAHLGFSREGADEGVHARDTCVLGTSTLGSQVARLRGEQAQPPGEW